MIPAFDITIGIAIAVALASYLLGAVPFGMVVARLMGLGNLREIGSGNIGATNVLRTGNKSAAALTLIFDAGKGALAVLLAQALYGQTAAQIAGLCAFLGHLYPVWLGFKGGKGVATFLGVILALNFWIGLAACATWLVTALMGRISSLAALVSAVMTPVWLLFFSLQPMLLLTIILALLICYRHGDNIKRIIAGTEPKIGKKE